MNETTKMLRRIDDEITDHRQQIAAHQVHIARLEDTRRVLQGLAEQDEAHRHHQTPAGASPTLMNGSHAKPVLIVRKVTQDEPQAAPKGKDKGKTRAPRGTSARAVMRDRVAALLSEPDAEPMTATEIGNYFGLANKDGARKDLQNALWYMRQAHMVLRDDEGRYSKPVQQ